MNSDPKLAYRESAARQSSPVGGVILLYEQAIHDLGGAIDAIGKNDIEERTRKINHALLVIGQLQGTLDLERGGEVSRNLDRFYGLMRARLIQAQFAGTGGILREQMDLLLSIRMAWVEVEKAEAQKNAPAPAQPAAPAPPSPQGSSSHWRA